MARRCARGLVLGCLLALAVVPTAHADVCCGTAEVTFDPPSALPGSTVRAEGLRCVEAVSRDGVTEGAVEMPLILGRFWLTSSDRDTFLESPESWSTDGWYEFAKVPDPTARTGAAVFLVPDLPPGGYQLWWECPDVRHFSTGPLFRVGPPDTATVAVPEARRSVSTAGIVIVALGALGFIAGMLRRPVPGRPRTT